MTFFDLATFRFINQFSGHSYILDGIMIFLAKYSLETYMALFLIAWIIFPKQDSAYHHVLVVMGLSGILALSFNFLIAHFWFRPRPFVILAQGAFNQMIPHSMDASFPSDHTSGSFGFAAASWNRTKITISWVFTIFAVLVGVSRIYLGVHWPTDVIAGILVGMISSRIVWAFNRWLVPITNLGLKLCNFSKYMKFE